MNRKWTEHDEWMLKELYPKLATEELATLLRKSTFSVYQKAYMMRLRKSDDYAEKLRKAFVEGNEGTRFQKGITPANKGKKMRDDVKAKLERTMFKKGHIPHNAKYDGHERVSKDGYVEVRVRAGVYVAKHRRIWEQENGAIPKGMIVVFKDKNPMNTDISNLELISRKENMSRNTIQRYPQELQKTIKTLGRLRGKIKSKLKQKE